MSGKDQLKSALVIMDLNGVKPNYAALAKKYDMDWRTVKKYHQGYEGKPKTRDKPSILDDYETIIKQKLSIYRTSTRSVYEFMVRTYGLDNIGSYSNFRYYVKKNKLKPNSDKLQAHPPYEVEPGEMIQCDLKEDIQLTSRSGEKFTINVLHLLLKFSRYSYIEVTLSKDQHTLFRCMINGFRYFGGVTDRILFDNMSTVANVSVRPKQVNSKMKQFAKDVGFEVKLCKARSGFTKGSNEARNKILDWFRPYDGEFKDFEELTEICEQIMTNMNMNVCQGTDVPPSLLFYKEKEYLKPLVNESILKPYLSQFSLKVDNRALIYYDGKKYSIDPKLIGERVEYELYNDKLYVYYKGKLQNTHEINGIKPVNYVPEHYSALLKGKVKDENIEQIAKENLSIMDKILEHRAITITKDDASVSPEGFMAYLSSGPNNNYIKRYYATFTPEQRREFYKELNKLLPYVIDEEQLFLCFKHTLDKNNISKFRFNVYIKQDDMNYTVISDEGMNLLGEEFREDIKKEYLERYQEYLEEKNDGNL